jgi:hypothetical protein
MTVDRMGRMNVERERAIVKERREQREEVNDNRVDLDDVVTPLRFGALGPGNTERSRLRYYDAAMAMMLPFTANATSAVEVGCVKPAFVRHLSWVGRKVCVAPYFAAYKGLDLDARDSSDDDDDVEYVEADFLTWRGQEYDDDGIFDVAMSLQVLEHVADPRAFMKKLLGTSRVVVVSVPYMWADCKTKCNHRHHMITADTLKTWSGNATPAVEIIVRERGNGAARLIAVYVNETVLP